MKLKKLIDSCYSLLSDTNIGIIASKNEKTKINEIYLVDSGETDFSGEQILTALDSLFLKKTGGYEVKAILNTHSHADHSGGNAFIFEKTHCKIYSPFNEIGGMINPFLESAVVWGGKPIKEIANDYYVMKKSIPTDTITAETEICLFDNAKITFFPLPGHYFEMFGIIYTNKNGEKAFFTGDAFLGRKHIAKYSIPFLYDVKEFLKTLEILPTVKANFYIPSHGDVLTRLDETVEMNKVAILSTITCILNILQKGDATFEEILKQLSDNYEIALKLPQYVLIGSTLRSYLTYLSDDGKIKYYIKDNKMFYKLAR